MIRGKNEDFFQRMLENQQRIAEGLDPLPPVDARSSAPGYLQEGSGHMGDGRDLPGAGRQAPMPNYQADKNPKGQRVRFNDLVTKMSNVGKGTVTPSSSRQNRDTPDGIPLAQSQTDYQRGADANERAGNEERKNAAALAREAEKSNRFGTGPFIRPNNPDAVNKVNPKSFMRPKPNPAPQDFPPQ